MSKPDSTRAAAKSAKDAVKSLLAMDKAQEKKAKKANK